MTVTKCDMCNELAPAPDNFANLMLVEPGYPMLRFDLCHKCAVAIRIKLMKRDMELVR